MTSTDNSVSVPDTLIVSWHWPPADRASARVLANLFRDAPVERFRVVTRCVPRPPGGDRTPVPPLETHGVRWGLANGGEGTVSVWLASVLATLCMMLKARRLYEDRPFERVVAVYPHRFGLLAGWWIARRTGVPFAAYMHDLFAESYRSGSRLKRMFWHWLDGRALADAALVAVPTAEFAAHYRGRGIDHLLVAPHCVPAGVPAAPAPPSGAVLKLVYAGNLYDAHEDAIKAFLRASDTLSDLSVTLLTSPHPMLGARPARWAPRRDALAAIREADAGVVALGHATPYPEEIHGCFPSKITDYLAVGRPMLGVVPSGCFVDRFIRETGAGIVVNTLDPSDIRGAIERLRDAGLRDSWGAAARRAARALDAEIHLPRFLRGLGTLQSGEDSTCSAPGPVGPGAELVMGVPVDAGHEGACALR